MVGYHEIIELYKHWQSIIAFHLPFAYFVYVFIESFDVPRSTHDEKHSDIWQPLVRQTKQKETCRDKHNLSLFCKQWLYDLKDKISANFN